MKFLRKRKLFFQPEGYRVDRNVPIIIDFSKKSINSSAEFEKTIDLQFPKDAVEGSRRARLDIIGIS